MTGGPPEDGEAAPAPAVASRYFPEEDGRGALARRYAAWLAGPGVARGLIGPREVPRLWDRHLLNCAAVGELLDPGGRVVDVGAGAGLPGLALALAVPGLLVDLVEPMQRRTDFLAEVVTDLSVEDRVRVLRGRAEDDAIGAVVGGAPTIVARAVAPLERLLSWCLPLLAPDGRLLAFKGRRAKEEIAALTSRTRRRVGGIEVVDCGLDLPEPTRVVVVQSR